MPNPEAQLRVLDREYVSVKDLMDLYGWGRPHATKEFKEIKDQMDDEGRPLMICGKTLRIPITRILKKYPMNYSRIQRAVRRK